MDEWEKDLADAIRHDPSARDAIVELAYRERAQKIYPPYASRKHDGSLAAALCKLIGLQPSEFNKLSREERIPYLNAALNIAKQEASLEELVTLDQVAPLTGKSKRTLERYLRDGKLPEPDVAGGGGKAHKWFWNNIRYSLEKVADKSKGSGLIGGTFGACYISLHAQT